MICSLNICDREHKGKKKKDIKGKGQQKIQRGGRGEENLEESSFLPRGTHKCEHLTREPRTKVEDRVPLLLQTLKHDFVYCVEGA